jgi:hypothetical protein
MVSAAAAEDATLRKARVPLMWLAVALVAGGIALCMGLGTLHDGNNADSLLMVLVSTQRWTPFYWGQDRYGMLVPLLATPVHDPLVNLLVQGWMRTLAGLLAPFVVARFLCGRGEAWLPAGALANLLLLLFASSELQFDWFGAQPHALAIALGFAALVAIEEARDWAGRGVALLLMLLASWINVSIVIALAPALVLRGGARVASGAIIALGTAGGILASRLVNVPATSTALVPISEWPHAWSELLGSAWRVTAHASLLGPTLVVAALGALALWRQGQRPALRAAAAAAGIGLANWIAVGTFEWVRLNLYYPRYLLPSFLMLAVAGAILCTAPARRHFRALGAGAGLALAAFALFLYGAPSLGRLERSLDERLGQMTPDILSSHATLVAGSYWTVWPAVFHANMRRYREHEDGQILGLTYRSAATDPLWLARPEPILVATALGDAAAADFAAQVGRQLDLVEHRPTIDLFTAAPRQAAEAASAR